MLINLVSNAANYGAGGPIQIVVRRQADRAVLVVRVHGIGIAEANPGAGAAFIVELPSHPAETDTEGQGSLRPAS
ncbi:ATP-binding protein [Sorangium sp. So ce854]|uniref:ATP-binding protein n=1 Tax=Sorangium sp. So ce854 TaxID=3133322 RepID=UPI003F5ECD24